MGNSEHMPVYALVGNPNSGKTTLFNHLTGLRQKVGNYSGVTVEKKEGYCFSQHGEKLKIIDLPGSYSLSVHSPDERVLQDVLMGRQPGESVPDRIICVVDASNLERNLFLAAQVAELGRPTLLVLNMMDVAEKRGIFIDTGRIEKALGVTVITAQANKKIGLVPLKLAMSRSQLPQPVGHLELPQLISEAMVNIQSTLIDKYQGNLSRARGEAQMLLLEGAEEGIDTQATMQSVNIWRKKLSESLPNWKSLIIQARYQKVDKIIQEAVLKKDVNHKTLTEYVDEVVLHKVFGWIFLLGVMGIMFFGIFSLAEYPMAGVEWCFDHISGFIENTLPEGSFRDLLVSGVISGIGSVVVFLPQIMLLFLFIGLLENSGYLPRAAFILDKIMGKVGLQGRAFIPLLSSYACAVPAIMATRTIRSFQERMATILVAPWMSCSARIPVYLLIIGVLLPRETFSFWQKAALLTGLYGLGTLGAFLMAWLLRKTLLKGSSEGVIMELPDYRMPCWKNASIEMIQRAGAFLKRAGSLIVTFSVLIWFLTNYPKQAVEAEGIQGSYLGAVGKIMEPAIKPLGYDWKLGVGLLGSFAARELFVSTMAVIYNVEAKDERDTRSLVEVMRKQRDASGNYIFNGLTCASLMVFFVFAMQCISTLVVVRKETNSWRWPIFQLLYMTGFAYVLALIIYQGGRFFL